MKTHKDREKKQRALGSANAALAQSHFQASAVSQKEQQQQLVREYEEQLVKLRESGWQGRSEGLDISRSLQSPMLLLDSSMDLKLPGTISKKKKVNTRTTTLPPLSNSTSNAGEMRPSSSSGAVIGGSRLPETFGVDIERHPEVLLQLNNPSSNAQEDSAIEDSEYEQDGEAAGEGEKKKKKKKVKKRVSETEKRLMSSPFAQPLVKH
jgi:hypothetical protein